MKTDMRVCVCTLESCLVLFFEIQCDIFRHMNEINYLLTKCICVCLCVCCCFCCVRVRQFEEVVTFLMFHFFTLICTILTELGDAS